MEMATFAIALVIGSVMLLTVSWVYARKQTFNLGGSMLTVFGTVLVGMSVWPMINVSVSNKGIEAHLQRVEAKIEQNGEISAAAKQQSTKAVAAVSQLNQQFDILRAQSALREQRLYNGPADGFLGPQTVASIERFQAQKSLPETGKLDEATIHALGLR